MEPFGIGEELHSHPDTDNSSQKGALLVIVIGGTYSHYYLCRLSILRSAVKRIWMVMCLSSYYGLTYIATI